MATATPNWTNGVSVVALAVLNNNGGANFQRRGTIDLTAKHGAYLHVRMGPTAATAPGVAISVLVRPVINAGSTAGGVSATHPVHILLSGSTAARNATTLNGAISAGATTLTLTTATGFVVGDICMLMDSVSSPTKAEFFRISKIASSVVTPDLPIVQAFANSAPIARAADVFPRLWLPGGEQWEVIFDYGATATGSDYLVCAFADRYDSDTIA